MRDLLKSLYDLDFSLSKFEVLVIGGSSDAESRKIVENEISHNNLNIAYLSCTKSRKSVLLNFACSQAKGRFLFFVDDDCVLIPDCLKKLSKVIEHETNIGVIGGSDQLSEAGSFFELALDCILNSFIGTGGLRKETDTRIGKYYPRLWNMTIAKDVIAEMNFNRKNGRIQVFNESLSIYEDVELVRRIEKSGKKIIYAPQVSVKHMRNTNFTSFVARHINSVRVSKALGIHHFPQIILGVFVLWLIIGGVLSLYYHYVRIIFLSFLTMYALLLFLVAIKGGVKHKNIMVGLYVPLLLFSLHFSRGLTYLILWPTRETERFD